MFQGTINTCLEIWHFLDIFKLSKNMSNMVNIIWEYQQPKNGKRLAESWKKVIQKVRKCWKKPWPKVAAMSARRRPSIGDVELPIKTTLGRRCSVNVGQTLALTSAWHRLDYIMLSGKRMKLQPGLCKTTTRKEGEMWQLEAGCHLNGIIHYTLYSTYKFWSA